MIKFGSLLLLLLLTIRTDAKPKGQILFEKNCLSCHNADNKLFKYDFTQNERLFALKNTLVQSVTDRSMPPNQPISLNPNIQIKGTHDYLSDSDRASLIQWLQNLQPQASYSLSKPQPPAPLQNLKADKIIELNIEDLPLLSQLSDMSETTSSYDLGLRFHQQFENKYYAFAYEVIPSPYTHHLEMSRYENLQKNFTFLWSIFHKKQRHLQKNNLHSVQNLVLYKHSKFIDSEMIYRDSDRIRLFLSEEKRDQKTSALRKNSGSWFEGSIYSDTIQLTLKIRHPSRLIAFFPHMHNIGKSFSLSVYRPVLKEPIPIGMISGWVEEQQDKYDLVGDVILNKGDYLLSQCTYKNKIKMFDIGWKSDEEMCLVSYFFTAVKK